MTLRPRWLDRLYWRWYLRRHPYHTAVPTLAFLLRGVYDGTMRDAIMLVTEECDWFRSEAVA